MEPTFKYLKNPENGNKDSVHVETKNVGEQNKEAEVIKRKKTNKHGSSLGWGWFQGFNLFVTGCFLFICLVFAYFMMGSDSKHEGLPKYSIDRSNDLGKAIFNPAISEEERESFVYKPPIRRPKVEEKPAFEEIELLSQASSNAEQKIDLPALSLISAVEDEPTEESDTPENFYGDTPFGLSMESLQLESTAQTEEPTQQPIPSSPEVAALMQQANNAWNKGQLSEPYQGSALSIYHQALEMDPNSQAAMAGLDRLANHYLDLSKRAFEYGDYFSALDYADLGLKADPLNPELNQIKSQLINE